MSSLATNCFTQYFLGGNIPQDLEINFNDTPPANLKYICQTRDNNFAVYYYATLFDEKYGVPVYSGYKISQSDGANIDSIPYTQRPSSNSWQTTPGEYILFVHLICDPECVVRSRKYSSAECLGNASGLVLSRVDNGKRKSISITAGAVVADAAIIASVAATTTTVAISLAAMFFLLHSSQSQLLKFLSAYVIKFTELDACPILINAHKLCL